jgi:hypothetical protein
LPRPYTSRGMKIVGVESGNIRDRPGVHVVLDYRYLVLQYNYTNASCTVVLRATSQRKPVIVFGSLVVTLMCTYNSDEDSST